MEFYCFERDIQLFGYFLVWQVAVTAEHEDFATLWWHLFQGFVYDMLGIPKELYTPLFAIARIVGWSAHRIEELVTTDKIIRPAYKSLVTNKDYVKREDRCN